MLERIVDGELVLRRPTKHDVNAITSYCKDRELARWIPLIPHPYERRHAEKFVEVARKEWAERTYTYAVEYEGELVGMVSLRCKDDTKAEIGYWMGKKHRGKGLTTRAARLIIDAGFKRLDLHRIYALFLEGNKGSKRVMEKLGMKHEGTAREHVKRFGRYYNESTYGILRKEWKRL